MFRTENINVASFVTMVTVLVPGMGFLLHGSVCVLYVDVLCIVGLNWWALWQDKEKSVLNRWYCIAQSRKFKK